MRGAYKKTEPWANVNAVDERVLLVQCLGVLGGGVDDGVDLAPESVRCLAKRRSQLLARGAADDHQIYIAVGALLAACEATEDVSKLNSVAERLEGSAHYVGESDGLSHDGLHLVGNRAIWIQPVRYLSADGLRSEDVGCGKHVQFARDVPDVESRAAL